MIKRAHGWLAFVILLATPVAGYYKTNQALYDEIARVRLERETEFARKDDMREIVKRLDRIAEDLAEIKGSLKRR